MFETILITLAAAQAVALVEILQAAFRASEPEDVKAINLQVKRPGAWGLGEQRGTYLGEGTMDIIYVLITALVIFVFILALPDHRH